MLKTKLVLLAILYLILPFQGKAQKVQNGAILPDATSDAPKFMFVAPQKNALTPTVAPTRPAQLTATEICNNGIDDDGDGLIDCLDTDCGCNACTRGQANNWYFGIKAGLSFNTNPPTVLSNGGLDTREGCATISDATGNLLFYSDGQSIWDKNHQIMPNGSGLLGCFSSAQSGVIVPHPKFSSQYYVFTNDCSENNLINGFRYNLVDMSLNGGLGDVVAGEKNVLLSSNSKERLTAIKHCNGRWYWILIHEADNNTFLEFLVDDTGINTTPIPQQVGSLMSSLCYLRASVSGTRLCNALKNGNLNTKAPAACELYDFNTATGVISNPILLELDGFNRPYGFEFSDNEQILYATDWRNNTGSSMLVQFDLRSGTSAGIKQSRVNLDTLPANETFGALQRAPNGKIYTPIIIDVDNPTTRSNGFFLGAINNQNSFGAACNYQYNAIDVRTGAAPTDHRVYLGLPNFIPSFFEPKQPRITGRNLVCGELPKTIKYRVYPKQNCATQTTWQFQGTVGQVQNTDDSTLTIRFNSLGNAKLIVKVTTSCTTFNDTLNILVSNTPILAAQTKTICYGDSVVVGKKIVYKTTGTYVDTLLSFKQCDSILTTNLTVIKLVDSLKITPISCYGGNNGALLAVSSLLNNTYKWAFSGGSVSLGNNALLRNLRTQIYSVSVTNPATTCVFTETITLAEPPALAIQFDSLRAVCLSERPNSANARAVAVGGTPPYQYRWSNGMTLPYITGLSEQTYTVRVLDANNCSLIGSLDSTKLAPAIYARDKSNVSCYLGKNGQLSYPITSGAAPVSFTWSNNYSSTRNFQDSLRAGVYSVTIVDAQNCQLILKDTLSQPPPFYLKVSHGILTCLEVPTFIKIDSVSGSNGRPYFYSLNPPIFSNKDSVYTNKVGDNTLFVQDALGCLDSFKVTIPPLLSWSVMALPQRVTVKLGDTLTLTAQASISAPISYQWIPSTGLICPLCKNSPVQPLQSSIYTVIATDIIGCTASDRLEILVEPTCNVYLPTVFSPNNDGLNDFFAPLTGNCVRNITTFKIFNRWGELIYNLTDTPTEQLKGWDGTFRGQVLTPGVFAYIITYKQIDGIDKTLIGDITLIR